MTHPADYSWRVGAVYRACVRYGMDKETAIQALEKRFSVSEFGNQGRGAAATKTVEIWWRNMDQLRAEYKESST